MCRIPQFDSSEKLTIVWHVPYPSSVWLTWEADYSLTCTVSPFSLTHLRSWLLFDMCRIPLQFDSPEKLTIVWHVSYPSSVWLTWEADYSLACVISLVTFCYPPSVWLTWEADYSEICTVSPFSLTHLRSWHEVAHAHVVGLFVLTRVAFQTSALWREKGEPC